jgi:CheY-like chemotaxis protein
VGTGASVAFVAVKDQGIGLAPDDLERIFDRFERAVPLSRVEGLGLGLWIAGRVVEARGGVISAEGQPGQGALFTVRLPLTQASLFGAGRSAVDSHTILIVEDEQESRESLTELLELEGFNVVTATNGLEAWEYLHTSHQPCLIVLDVTMPVMDGRQFRQLQLKDDELAKIPTIVVSALSASATADLAALKAFRKPVNFAALISVLRDNCGRRDPDANY